MTHFSSIARIGWAYAAAAALALVSTSEIFAFSPAVASTTVTFNSTLNLSTPGVMSSGSIVSNGTGTGFSAVTPQSVAAGDNVVLHYDFGGDGVSASSLTFEWANIWDWNPAVGTNDGAPEGSVNLTGVFKLLGSDGSVLYTSASLTDSECCVHIGQTFSTLVGPITFYGIEYDGVLNSSDAGTRSYNLPGLDLNGTGFVLIPGSVPEPASWALMLIGFAGVGLTVRSKRRTFAAAA